MKLSQSLLTKLSTELLNEKKIIYLEKDSQKRTKKTFIRNKSRVWIYFIGVIINHIETTIILANPSFSVKEIQSFPTEKDWNLSLMKTKENIDNILKKNSLDKNNLLGIEITLKELTDEISSLYGIWKEPVNIFDFFQSIIELK